MEHDTKRLNSYLDCIARCQEGMSYQAMLNLWMEESGSSLADTEELEFYIKLIPMVFKRRRMKAMQSGNRRESGALSNPRISR